MKRRALTVVVVALAVAACSSPPVDTPPVQTAAPPPQLTGCQPHIELQDAAFWAGELGRTEMWVLQNHRINLWQRAGGDRGAKIGEMLPGSRAPILEETNGAYRIRSPLDQSIGWVSDVQVARTLRQDVETREACSL